MARLIFLIVVFALVYWLLRSFRNAIDTTPPSPPHGEDMVVCAYCGVHLPKSEGLADGGRYYCCEAHRRGKDKL